MKKFIKYSAKDSNMFLQTEMWTICDKGTDSSCERKPIFHTEIYCSVKRKKEDIQGYINIFIIFKRILTFLSFKFLPYELSKYQVNMS